MSSVLGPLVPPLLPLLLLLLLLLLCDDTSSLRTPRRVRPPPSSLQMLNRLMVHPHEVSAAGNKVCIPLSDPRAQHAATILRCRDGDALRVGVLDEGVDDAAVVRWVWPAGYSHGWLDADGDNGPLLGVGGRGRREEGRARPRWRQAGRLQWGGSCRTCSVRKPAACPQSATRWRRAEANGSS